MTNFVSIGMLYILLPTSNCMPCTFLVQNESVAHSRYKMNVLHILGAKYTLSKHKRNTFISKWMPYHIWRMQAHYWSKIQWAVFLYMCCTLLKQKVFLVTFWCTIHAVQMALHTFDANAQYKFTNCMPYMLLLQKEGAVHNLVTHMHI